MDQLLSTLAITNENSESKQRVWITCCLSIQFLPLEVVEVI